MAIHIGLSGWSYREWARTFYPSGLPPSEWLSFVAREFSTVEVNRSFYSLLKPETYRSWADQSPAGFRFSVKGSRFITHMKRLRDVEAPLANFYASGVLELGDRLAAFLWQLPAKWSADPGVTAKFLSMLPRTTGEAAHLAKRHDHRVGTFEAPSHGSRTLRHALELRHPEALTPAIIESAEANNVAVVMSDASPWPLYDASTADFRYLRMHGPEALYSSGYSAEELEGWASRLRRWEGEGDVFVYFDNDSGAHAPRDARALRGMLGPIAGEK
jgi:uncharacterized protein YecE (DUF72 family)